MQKNIPVSLFQEHQLDHSAFEEYVLDKSDILGMVSYCVYKMKKVEYCKQHPNLTEQEVHDYCKAQLQGKRFLENRKEADAIIGAVADKIALNILQDKRNDLIKSAMVGLVTGVVCALFANPFWNWVGDLVDHRNDQINITKVSPAPLKKD
jgi:hypothetical protein